MSLRASEIQKYDLTSRAFHDDPVATWNQMLNDGDVVRSKMMFMGKAWFANSWQAASDVMRDQKNFSRDRTRFGKSAVPGVFRLFPKKFTMLAENMVAKDGEDHRRLRSLVDQAFLRSQVETMRPQIQSIANRFADEIEKRSRQNNGIVDLEPGFRESSLWR